MVWIAGGDCNAIDDELFRHASANNDQTAAAFWQEGMVTMFPSLRGGNGNPGRREGFFGEVEDVVAALEFVRGIENVDAERVFLGGHSTGGTLVLLVAEVTDRFRAAFAFGPVADVRSYPKQIFPFDLSDEREIELRAPVRWLDSIRRPVFIFEGADPPGNAGPLRTLAAASKNPLVHVQAVTGANHFTFLHSFHAFLARQLMSESDPIKGLAVAGDTSSVPASVPVPMACIDACETGAGRCNEEGMQAQRRCCKEECKRK